MFAWSIDVIWSNIEQHLPEHAQHMGPLVEKVTAPDWESALATAFEKLPKISIDFGVMACRHTLPDIDVLADYLQQNPSVLLRGKDLEDN